MAPGNTFSQAAASLARGEQECWQLERGGSGAGAALGLCQLGSQRTPRSSQPRLARFTGGKSREQRELSSKGRRAGIAECTWQSHWHSPEEEEEDEHTGRDLPGHSPEGR